MHVLSISTSKHIVFKIEQGISQILKSQFSNNNGFDGIFLLFHINSAMYCLISERSLSNYAIIML